MQNVTNIIKFWLQDKKIHKRNGENFHMVRQLQEAFDKILTLHKS
jgi:hypothetical protein